MKGIPIIGLLVMLTACVDAPSAPHPAARRDLSRARLTTELCDAACLSSAFGPDLVLRVQGKSVLAFFDNTVGCTESAAIIGAFEDALRDTPDGPVASTVVSAILNVRDLCTHTAIRQVNALTTEPVDLQVDPNLSTATLHATLDAFDTFTGQGLSVDVSLVWVATGPPEAITSAGTDTTVPGYLEITNLRQLARPAAATGTISDGTYNYVTGPSWLGQIADVLQGDVVVHRPH